ncbi:MAG: TSUP family transporter [Paracoccaceae bacterium]
MTMTLPLGLGAGQAAALGLALFAAAFVRGYSGFGFSALVVAFSALLVNPVLLVPVVVLCEIAMSTSMLRGVAGDVDWRRFWPMLAGATLVMPVSVTAIAQIGEERARIAISLMILVMAVVLLTGWTLRRVIGRWGHAGVGMASGLANGAAVGGLPVAAFMAAQPIAARTFRATLTVYAAAVDIVALPIMWANGMVTRDSLIVFVVALPLLAAGVMLGGKRFFAASPQNFRRMTILLLIVLSVLGLLKSVM